MFKIKLIFYYFSHNFVYNDYVGGHQYGFYLLLDCNNLFKCNFEVTHQSNQTNYLAHHQNCTQESVKYALPFLHHKTQKGERCIECRFWMLLNLLKSYTLWNHSHENISEVVAFNVKSLACLSFSLAAFFAGMNAVLLWMWTWLSIWLVLLAHRAAFLYPPFLQLNSDDLNWLVVVGEKMNKECRHHQKIWLTEWVRNYEKNKNQSTPPFLNLHC